MKGAIESYFNKSIQLLAQKVMANYLEYSFSAEAYLEHS